MTKPPKADYCIEIQFEKGSRDPARVFRTMQEMIETFHEFDRSLVKAIDSSIEPVLILEDIESGSIRSWLSNILEAVDDDALKNIDWKPAVGKYLVKAKYFAVDFLNGKTQISNASEVRQLEDKIHEIAKETDVKWLPVYEKIPPKRLLHSLERISSSLSHLQKNDNASYLISDDEKVNFNLEFSLVPESIDDLLTKDKIASQAEMILKVKKPDYLGESKWDFRHGGRSFPAKIIHREWLESFQDREVDIRPGDSIRAKVEIINKYDFDGELISTDHSILQIFEVIQISSSKQIEMFDKEK
jgi:hypothetical protein